MAECLARLPSLPALGGGHGIQSPCAWAQLPAGSPEAEQNLRQFDEAQRASSSTWRTHPVLPDGSSLTLASVSPLVRRKELHPWSLTPPKRKRKIKHLKNHQLFENTKGAKEMHKNHRMSEPEGVFEVSWSKSTIVQMWKLRPREGK